MELIVVLVLLLINNLTSAEDEGILCTAKTCSDYISENPCSSLPNNCNIQNSTYNGIFLPSTDPCGCCQFCLVNLNEGDYCAEGEDGGLIPDTICGPGLFCSGGVCTKMSELETPPTECTKAQADYDSRRKSGTSLGSMETRPNCDDDGFYLPYKCVSGQTCFCVDKDGKRIFGEISYTSSPHLLLKCQCSRKYNEVLKFFNRDSLYPNEHFRCTENGDYDTIQCIGDNCMCTDSFDGAPTFPIQAPVNISEISTDTLSDCFKTGVHLERKYYYTCAEHFIDILNEIEEYKDDGYDEVFEVVFPNCDLQGKYAPVQTIKTIEDNVEKISYHCVRSDGTRIENYVGSPEDTKTMDCKCARSNLLSPKDTLEKPKCCRNGNFNPVQCRRGKCYCVDTDGYQDVSFDTTNNDKFIEVSVDDDVTSLFCYDQKEQEECNSVN